MKPPGRGELIKVSDFVRKHNDEAREPRTVPPISLSASYIGMAEYSERLGVSRATIYGLLEAGRVEGAVKVGKQWRIPVRA